MALSLLGGCDSASQATRTGPACPVQSADGTGETRQDVVVRGDNAPCFVTFTPVEKLTGTLMGTLPRPPVVAGPGGRWLTATYNDGEFAVWSPGGRLERVIGRGSGDGPGEFRAAMDLVVDSVAGTVHVLTSAPRIEVYSLDGDYLNGIRLPASPYLGSFLDDGTIVTSSAAGLTSRKIMLVMPDTAFETGPARRFGMPNEVRTGAQGVWTAESQWYEFDHHVLPGGEVDRTIRREVDWFPVRSAEENLDRGGARVSGFTVDPGRRLFFTRILGAADPDAPSAPPAPGRSSRDEVRKMNARYLDGIVEVFTFDGDLVATTRFDDPRQMPTPIGGGAPGNLWFRVTDGLTQSIEILRPELVEDTDRR